VTIGRTNLKTQLAKYKNLLAAKLAARLGTSTKKLNRMATLEFGQGMIPEGDMDGENVRRKFLMFLNEFKCEDEHRQTIYYYRQEVAAMIKLKRTTLFVNFDHLMTAEGDLAQTINIQYYRYIFVSLDTNHFSKELFKSLSLISTRSSQLRKYSTLPSPTFQKWIVLEI
jgi:hypothetical protein